MCGIVGYVGHRQAAEILLEGLKRLEYRGYDSAGIAIAGDDGIVVQKSAGKLAVLESLVGKTPPAGSMGIGHTRWATHGAPTTANAHPHTDDDGGSHASAQQILPRSDDNVVPAVSYRRHCSPSQNQLSRHDYRLLR